MKYLVLKIWNFLIHIKRIVTLFLRDVLFSSLSVLIIDLPINGYLNFWAYLNFQKKNSKLLFQNMFTVYIKNSISIFRFHVIDSLFIKLYRKGKELLQALEMENRSIDRDYSLFLVCTLCAQPDLRNSQLNWIWITTQKSMNHWKSCLPER